MEILTEGASLFPPTIFKFHEKKMRSMGNFQLRSIQVALKTNKEVDNKEGLGRGKRKDGITINDFNK